MSSQTMVQQRHLEGFQINGQDVPKLELNLSKYAKLSPEQAGHIRHFHNLASQEDGSWSHMGALDPGQEFLDASRYQLATMAYAIGVAHYHRLPALRSVMKPLFRRLIHKMLRRDVWGYWFLTSHSGKLCDPDIKELRKPWADPVVRENIMYSGHLLLMISLYAMLFDDDEFEQPESLVFKWDPLFWGMGPETFSYDVFSLQKAILREMERNDWVGVCCEPNAVFVVCNQFPIIAMRYNDARHGTQAVEGVLEKYRAAWEKRGMISQDGLFVDWIYVKQQMTIPPKGVPPNRLPPRELGFTAWAAAYMNTWNSELVKSQFEQQAKGYLTKINGQYRLRPVAVANALRNLLESNHLPESQETLDQAVLEAKSLHPTPHPYVFPTYGCVAQWLSELGKTKELEGLLEHADIRLRPSWENGGLFYPRYDHQDSPTGDWTHMEPFSGNAGIGYSRLNVTNGQKIMWESPWTRDILESRPWVDGIRLDDGVDYLRGTWDEKEKALVVTARTWDGSKATLKLAAMNLPKGHWGAYVSQQFRGSLEIGEERGSFGLEVEVDGEEVDIVFIRK